MTAENKAVNVSGSLWQLGEDRAASAIVDALASGQPGAIATATSEGQAILNKAWSSAAHPRAAAGSSAGGQFIAAGSGSTGQQKQQAQRGAERLLGKKLSVAAIRAFQAAHGIQVDGRIGTQTAAALLGAAHPERLKPGPMTARQRQGLEQFARHGGLPQLVKPPKPAGQHAKPTRPTKPNPSRPRKPNPSAQKPKTKKPRSRDRLLPALPPPHKRDRLLSTAKAFSPSERRDREGRWTTGGAVTHTARRLGQAISELKPGDEIRSSTGRMSIRRLPKPDLARNEFEVSSGLEKTRHKTAAQAYERATRIGFRMPSG